MKLTYITLFLIAILQIPLPLLSGTDKSEIPYSQQEAEKSFTAGKWYSGSYFLLGMGPSALATVTTDDENKSLAGIHMFTSLGYWAFDAVSFEIGAIISFNFLHDVTITSYRELDDETLVKQKLEDFHMLMWDSSFYWGVMVRWPFTRRTDNINIFVRLFQGYGTSVAWFINESFEHEDEEETIAIDEASRFFAEGILFGFSVGNIFNAFNKKTVWFIQVSAYLKMFRKGIALKDGGVLPEELETHENRNNTHQMQINLTIGLRLY